MANNLKRLREAKGLQQQEMAKLMGLNVTFYNKIERGHKNLTVRKALKVAEILECSLDDIFLDSNVPKRTKE
jgi:putative transcriptional regulator